MILSTMNDLRGYEIEEVHGEVFGLTVRSRNVGAQLGAQLGGRGGSAGGGWRAARRVAKAAR